MYKGKKYNAILLICVLIISVFIGFSASLGGAEDDLSTNNPNDIVIPLPNLPESGDDSQVGDDEQPTNKAPSFADGYQAIEYALDILENGNGYTSVFSQRINGEYKGVGVTQSILVQKYSGKELDFTEEYCFTETSLGVNQYKSFFSDGTDMKVWGTTNQKYFSYQNLTYQPENMEILQECTVENYTQVQGQRELNKFFTPINKSTCKVLLFDKRDAKSYSVKVQLYPEKIDQTYINGFEANGAKLNKLLEMTLVFKINKQTGYLESIEKIEKVDANYGILKGASVNITMKEVYTSMNKDHDETILSKVEKFK